MTKIKLSKRLKTIASMVDKNSIIADIGCDHALLDIYLSQNKIINKSIAVDVNKNALNFAIKNIKQSGVYNVFPRLGDGLFAINKEDKVNTLIISGLGDQKIIFILKENVNALSSINNIIIQSNAEGYQVRSKITKLGYFICDETLVLDKKIMYTIIKFKKGNKKYNKRQLFFGPKLLVNKDPLFYNMVNNLIEKNKFILNHLPNKKIIKKINLKLQIYLLKKEIL